MTSTENDDDNELRRPKEPPPWVSYALQLYHGVGGEIGHFGMKTVNSNAAAAGLRLGADRGLTLPYLAVRTLIGSGADVPLDYFKMGTVQGVSTSVLTRQLKLALAGDPCVPDGEGEQIARECRSLLRQSLEVGLGAVSPRVRQVLIPRGEGYVALTPLSSAGVSQLIGQRVNAHNERVKGKGKGKEDEAFRNTHGLIRGAVMAYGGTKSQNISSLGRHLRRLVFVRAPRENPALREAFAIFCAGPRVRLPRSLMTDYARWRQERLRSQEPETMADREDHRRHLEALTQAVLASVRRQSGVLRAASDRLPVEPSADDVEDPSLFAKQVDPLLKALVEPRWRTSSWPREMARHIVQQMTQYRFPATAEAAPGPSGAVMGLDAAERAWATDRIEEILWNC